MEYIITFKNTSHAIKAEQTLLQAGLNIGVLPLPPQVRAGCGICLRVGQDEIKAALAALCRAGIEETELFSREEENKRYVYTEIKDKSAVIQ